MAFQGVRMLVVGIGLLSAQAALAQQYSLAVEGSHAYTQARAINTAGQVAGDFYLGARPFIWDGRTLQELGLLPGTSGCQANAINDSG